MVNRNLLDLVMVIEIALLVLAVGFFAHGVWLFITQKQFLRDMTAARDSLARLLTRGTINIEEIDALRRVPRDAQVAAFLEASRNLAGAGKNDCASSRAKFRCSSALESCARAGSGRVASAGLESLRAWMCPIQS